MKTSPKFDWHSGNLTPETIITGSYKTTQNVRRFFKKYLGEDFHFTRHLMQYIRDNEGKTLSYILKEWKGFKK